MANQSIINGSIVNDVPRYYLTEGPTSISPPPPDQVVTGNILLSGNYKIAKHVSYTFTFDSMTELITFRDWVIKNRNGPFDADNTLAYLRQTDNNNRVLYQTPESLTITLDFDEIPKQ